ncbi:aspartyl/asparaginyl beta-hydroxylase domain-containing protein [Mucilaginibacter agri]|uniref:Cupin domain-containing protein n=1 Tax=Mucilaginibacter agri TaxID=2695265 RepID=A0A965ZFR9_9SPHI|nr:aspartyl/asparaginyl beta-hydroxylase domain-containing protein [Mucilaginibacter agri]NCD70234.1 cupin domain-containing protein [Mucilaginibacter agri]
MIAYSKANLTVPINSIRADLERIDQKWHAHFNNLHYQGNWTVLPLRTPGGTDSIIPELMNADTFEDHPNMELFPSVKKLLGQFKCDIMSVRLLNLCAGSVIKEHRDIELAFENGEARLHVPIITNPDVAFYVNSERVIMNEGECWYINANLPHRVTNNGTTDRIHLVIDCKVNSWLKDLILNADIIAFAPEEGHSPEVLLQMIVSLRSQNTPTANAMADDFQKQYNTLSTINNEQ